MTKSEHDLTVRALTAEIAVNRQAVTIAKLTAQLHQIEAANLDAELKALGEWKEEAPANHPPAPTIATKRPAKRAGNGAVRPRA